MRILHVTKKYPNALGGDAIVVSSLEKEQTKQGHIVYIATTNCPEIIEKESLYKFGLKDKAKNLDKISFKRVFSLIILTYQGLLYIKKIKPDVIHSHSSDIGFIISIPAKAYHIPVINTAHIVTFTNKEYHPIKRFAELFFLKYAGFKKIITVDKSSLSGFKKERIKRVEYIPNGVDLEYYCKQKAGKDDQIIRFLFIGRLEKQKGLEYLLQAVRILKNQNKKFLVTIVGNGSQEKNLKKLSKELEIEELIKFEGIIENKLIPEQYQNADIFILPSIHEGFPLVNLEAMASGLPIIATNVGSIPETVKDGVNGILVRPRDAEKLAEAMKKLIENETLRNQLGNKGREIAKEEYGWKKIAGKIMTAYATL
jgi:glycosyltransferase involved in cell wall biosynthesis